MKSLSLRPKYTLDKPGVQGARATINAAPFTELTSRHYPYPRVGTRAPNGMFPYVRTKFQHGNGIPLPPAGRVAPKGIPGVLMPKFQHGNGIPLPPRGRVAPKGIPGVLMPKFQQGNGNPEGSSLVRMPWGYMEAGPVVKAGAIQPHWTLDKTAVQGVMPASIYRAMTGKLTTEFTLPPRSAPSLVRAPTAPAAALDWGSVFGGVVLGGLVTLGMVYGVIPAMAEWGAKAIRKRS